MTNLVESRDLLFLEAVIVHSIFQLDVLKNMWQIRSYADMFQAIKGFRSVYLYGQTEFQLLQISISGFSHPRSAFQVFCFFAFQLFSFSAFRLFGFSAFLLFGFSAFWLFGFLAYRLFGFSTFRLFSFSAFQLFSFSAFRLFCFFAFSLFRLSPFLRFSFLSTKFQLLSMQPLGLSAISASQISYLSSGPLFTLLRKLNGGRKNEER